MKRRPGQQILTDDDVRDILLAPTDVSIADLARRFGVSAKPVSVIRKRMSFRAIALAKEMGLLPLSPPRTVFLKRSARTRTVTASQARRA